MEREIDKLKKEVEEEVGTIHTDEIKKLLGRDEFSFEWVSEDPKPEVCIFCSSPWTPEMMSLYIAGGYCESCYNTEYSTIIACSNCGKIVYKK